MASSFRTLMTTQLARAPWFLCSLIACGLLIFAAFHLDWPPQRSEGVCTFMAEFEDFPDDRVEPSPDWEQLVADHGCGLFGMEEPLRQGLDWLARHQSSDGHWSEAAFGAPCESACSGPDEPNGNVGATALAALALMGAHGMRSQSPFRAHVRRAHGFLHKNQNSETGQFGQGVDTTTFRSHVLATLVMVEAYHLSKYSPLLADSARRGFDFMLRPESPLREWLQASPTSEPLDPDVIAWTLLTLQSARENGLEIEPSFRIAALGRTEESAELELKKELAEVLAAASLLGNILAGRDAEQPAARALAARLLEQPSYWLESSETRDPLSWYLCACAALQQGGAAWDTWRKVLQAETLPHQRGQASDCLSGSWDPTGARGNVGSRVYSTAMTLLCLEVYYRYDSLVGSRVKRNKR